MTIINKPFAAVLLAAVAAAAAAPAGADASRFNPQAHFSVTAKGSIDETWSYTRDGCTPSGSEHVDFATPKPAKVIVALYDGVKGSVPVTGTLSRSGTGCGEFEDVAGCGTKQFRSRLANFSNLRSNWGFDLGVRDYGGGCPSARGADPLAGTTTAQAVHDGPKWEWQGLLSTKRRGDRPKKVQTVTYKDHRVIDSGQRVVDVTWTVTFKRLEAIH